MTLHDVSLELLLKDLCYARAKASRLGFADVVEAIEGAIIRLALAMGRDPIMELSSDEFCSSPGRLPPAR